ncbi:pseudouridylate synthase TRUB2, mitochondrial [Leptinotarsa decemlineata]|uniref:pseudouridylate synthase TRUB2, mitochondrial n=1 Tax=Leptinotarsa decemlineata TaxID=7539 RepID=UPI003D30B1D7
MRPDSDLLWNALKGIVCVYKPAESSVRNLRKTLIWNICKDLSDLDVKLRYPERKLSLHDGSVKELATKEISTILTQNEITDLSVHPNVVGPKYLQDELAVSWSNYLGWNTSGVLIFGLKKGTMAAKFIRENRPTRAYRIKGVFGLATDTGFKDGKVVERSTWKYIRQSHIDRLLSSMQAAHQKKMFESCGVNIQSQLAYDLAVKGPIRPINSKIPIIYGLKCVEYDAPNFVLEVQCINENEQYLTTLIHEIGLKLHSTAHCTAVKCIRHSCFTLDHALLPKHWNLENIVKNLEISTRLLRENEHLTNQDSITLR